MSNDKMLGEKWIGKYVEESRCGPICSNIPAFERFELPTLVMSRIQSSGMSQCGVA
jgi:hypothetical protein